jgi:hypothetical protein
MNRSQVSAVIATRGDVDLTPILETLDGYGEILTWRSVGVGCFGRWLGVRAARFDTIYLQDDDLIFTAHDGLLAAHEPGRITANMPSPWYEACGYDREGSVQVGAGALLERETPWPAFQTYLARWRVDRLFYDYCDDVAGILCPSLRVDLGYEVLPCASDPGRISTAPGAAGRRAEMARRALGLRAA